jgi:hypothetical protein
MPSSGLWEQAQPGWRSAADMQRVEAWRAETNVRREGVGSPEPPRDTCAGCQPAPTWGAQSQVRRGSTRPASAVPNRIGILPFARCTPATLRHPGSACRRARLPGIGSPSLAITTHLMPIQRRIPRLTQQAPSGSEGITGGSMMRPLARHLNAASVHDSSHASRRWTCAALLQADRP